MCQRRPLQGADRPPTRSESSVVEAKNPVKLTADRPPAKSIFYPQNTVLLEWSAKWSTSQELNRGQSAIKGQTVRRQKVGAAVWDLVDFPRDQSASRPSTTLSADRPLVSDCPSQGPRTVQSSTVSFSQNTNFSLLPFALSQMLLTLMHAM
jgi:hypothetical protein